MFLWDPGNGLVLGIFRAVSGLSELIDRTAWARPGSIETPLPWQVRGCCILVCVAWGVGCFVLSAWVLIVPNSSRLIGGHF